MRLTEHGRLPRKDAAFLENMKGGEYVSVKSFNELTLPFVALWATSLTRQPLRDLLPINVCADSQSLAPTHSKLASC